MIVRTGIVLALAAGLLAIAPGDDIEYAQPIPIIPIDTVYRPPTTTTVVSTSAVPVSTTANVVRVTTTTTTLPRVVRPDTSSTCPARHAARNGGPSLSVPAGQPTRRSSARSTGSCGASRAACPT